MKKMSLMNKVLIVGLVLVLVSLIIGLRGASAASPFAQCENEGWTDFSSSPELFKNQGDCVSFFASQQNQTRSVILADSSLGEFHYNNCPSLTLLLQNNSETAQAVTISVELRGPTGQAFQQSFNDYVAQPTNGNFDVLQSPCGIKLPNGNYFYSVSIYSASNKHLLHQYNSVETFIIAI